MLAQAAAWWHRLLNRPAWAWDQSRGVAGKEDRRVSIRFPADLETTLLSPDQPKDGGFTARICDVSCRGARLVTDRPFVPGSLLTIVLPAAAGSNGFSVLACVVHSRAAGQAEWHIGCSFSAELDSDDLRAFGATTAHAAGPDGRSWKRFPCDGKATYQRLSEGDTTHHPAQVQNISANGVALLVPDELPVGLLLNAELSTAAGHTFAILACVVHLTPAAQGGFMAGCNFIRELDEVDLRALAAEDAAS